jgi:hypothetical protein
LENLDLIFVKAKIARKTVTIIRRGEKGKTKKERETGLRLRWGSNSREAE